MNKQPKTFRQMLVKSLTKGMFTFAALMLSFSLVNMTANQSSTDVDALKPHPVGSPAEMVTRFVECWSKGNHGMPSHVIYRPSTGGDWKVGGTKMVGVAFEQLFNHAPKTLDIYAFCGKVKS